MFVKRSLQKQESVNVAIASNYFWAVERERDKKKKEKKRKKKKEKKEKKKKKGKKVKVKENHGIEYQS